MDAPDADWFARHNGPDGSWTGPGLVVTADYSQFNLYGDDPNGSWEAGESVAILNREGNVLFSTAHKYGPVAVQIETRSSAPDSTADSGWDAESSFILPVADDSLLLMSWAGYGPSHEVEIPLGDHHLLARRASCDLAGDDPTTQVRDFFLVQLWPTGARTECDRILLQRAEDEAAAEKRERDRRDAWIAQIEEDHRRAMWGDLEPPPELERLGGDAASVASGSYQLALDLARSDAPTARAMAAWAVESIAAEIDHPPIDLEPALTAIRTGAPLPPPFDDTGTAFNAMLPEPTGAHVASITFGPSAHPRGPISAPSATCAAIISARPDSPAATAMGALVQAAAGFADQPAFWRRAEAAFDRLR